MIAKSRENHDPGDDLYDVKGLAKRLGKSELSIKRMAKRRAIPSFRLGRTLYFSLREVLESVRVTADTQTR